MRAFSGRELFVLKNIRVCQGLLLLVLALPSIARAEPATLPTAACTLSAKTCVGLVLHVVEEEGKTVVPSPWIGPRIAQANRLFEPVGVQFAVIGSRRESSRYADLRTRQQRDLLGRGKSPKGAVHLFVVRRLADVDVANAVIRGVHWRDRSKSGERWIILSSIAPTMVLAHELGHFFGLPHSADGRSLMNKQKGGGRPAWPTRTFLEVEHRRMIERRDEMLNTGRIRALKTAPRLN